MNLVAPGTIANARTRHIEDSAQLAGHIPAGITIIDLGSGAGFPALVLAILGRRVLAIESTRKKCDFMNIVKKALDLPNLEVINGRVESALPRIFLHKNAPAADNFIFTARAFAPLIKILDMTARYRAPYALLKGRTANEEIIAARVRHGFDAKIFPSETGDGKIILLTMK